MNSEKIPKPVEKTENTSKESIDRNSQLKVGLLLSVLVLLVSIHSYVSYKAGHTAYTEFNKTLFSETGKKIPAQLVSKSYDQGIYASTLKTVWMVDGVTYELTHKAEHFAPWLEVTTLMTEGDAKDGFVKAHSVPGGMEPLLVKTTMTDAGGLLNEFTIPRFSYKANELHDISGILTYEKGVYTANYQASKILESMAEGKLTVSNVDIYGESESLYSLKGDSNIEVNVGEIEFESTGPSEQVTAKNLKVGITNQNNGEINSSKLTFSVLESKVGAYVLDSINVNIDASVSPEVLKLGAVDQVDFTKALSARNEIRVHQFDLAYGQNAKSTLSGNVALQVPPEQVSMVMQNPAIALALVEGKLELDMPEEDMKALSPILIGGHIKESKVNKGNLVATLESDAGKLLLNGLRVF